MTMRWGDEQRRQRMRQALELLKHAVRQAGDELSWCEQPRSFDLYVNGTWDSEIGLDELARLEAWLRAQG